MAWSKFVEVPADLGKIFESPSLPVELASGKDFDAGNGSEPPGSDGSVGRFDR